MSGSLVYTSNAEGLINATSGAINKQLGKIGAIMMKSARKSIKTRQRSVRGGVRKNKKRGTFGYAGASVPGTPHHTRKGLSRKAIQFAIDRPKNTLYVGPSFKIIGPVSGVHERGGEFRGATYPKRAVMVPTLHRNWSIIKRNFNSIL